jgi:hypothetical protein
MLDPRVSLPLFLTNGSFIIRDGSTTRFWDDKCVGNVPLRERYPSLFNIVRDPHASVAKILATHPLNISFRRTLQGSKLTDWLNLVAQISPFSLMDGTYTFRWNITNSGLFTVRLLDSHPPCRHKKTLEI